MCATFAGRTRHMTHSGVDSGVGRDDLVVRHPEWPAGAGPATWEDSPRCLPQHPKFGIRWENIAQRLTKRNWKRKAVVRLDGSGSLLASPGHCCDAGGGIDSRLTRP